MAKRGLTCFVNSKLVQVLLAGLADLGVCIVGLLLLYQLLLEAISQPPSSRLGLKAELVDFRLAGTFKEAR